MSIVYLFKECSSIKIPFLGYNNEIIKQLTHSGGVWDADYNGLIFKKKIDVNYLKSIFSIICTVTNNDLSDYSGKRIQYYGTFKDFCKTNITFMDSNKGSINYKKRKLLSETKADTNIEMSLNCSLQVKIPEYMLRKLEFEIQSRKFSIKTQKAYIYYIKLLCKTLQKSPEEIHSDDVTEFLAVMEKKRKYSASSLNLAISAIKFFFRNVLNDNSVNEQKRPSNDKNLPMILSSKEIIRILNTEKNPKHRLLLMLVYSSGLRVSEAVSLKKEHIDLSRLVIYIRQGKGRKDRYTMLSEKAALFIQGYYKQYNIDKWIFPGQSGINHITIRSAQRIFEKAVLNAGITKEISIHGLRHTFATHLLENGTDIRYIQTLLGHANIRTTERYTHIAKRNVLNIKSPLDSL